MIYHCGISLTAKLTDFSGYLILVTAVALTIVCWVCVERFDFSRLWTFANYSGEAGGSVRPAVSGSWVFLLGETLANVERGEESEMKPKRTAALDHGAW